MSALDQITQEIKSLKEETGKKVKALEAQNVTLAEENTRLKKLLEAPNYGGAQVGKLFATARDTKEEGKLGFKSFSEFAKCVKSAGDRANGYRDPRFDAELYQSRVKAVSGMSEGTGADGGFLVPPEFSNVIFERVYQNDILERTDKYNCSGNNMVFNAIDETSRVDGSRFGGVLSYWIDEAAQLTKSQPKLRRIELYLKKLAGLAYITEELLSDSSVALEQFLMKLFAQEIAFRIGDAIINGNGVGKPLGVLNSGALVTVAKENGQAAKTILPKNIFNMWSRMWAPSRQNSVWFIHQDTEPALQEMTLGNAGSQLAVYLPPGGLNDAPYGKLLGRPVIPIEFANTLGSVGDIMLVDLSQYLTLNKGTSETASSMHLRFDFDEMAFRIIFRVDGRPWWHQALTPFKGTNTWSPFVTLAAR